MVFGQLKADRSSDQAASPPQQAPSRNAPAHHCNPSNCEIPSVAPRSRPGWVAT